jgi:hypothetical protein
MHCLFSFCSIAPFFGFTTGLLGSGCLCFFFTETSLEIYYFILFRFKPFDKRFVKSSRYKIRKVNYDSRERYERVFDLHFL